METNLQLVEVLGEWGKIVYFNQRVNYVCWLLKVSFKTESEG